MAQTVLPAGRPDQAAIGWREPATVIWITALGVVGIVTVASALGAALYPGIRPQLLQEDGIVETASALTFLLAVLGSIYAMMRRGPSFPLVLAGLIGFAELMDEISFGSRIFGFEPPPLYGGGELDGFHDLLILVYRLARDLNPELAWLWVGALFAGSVIVALFALSQIWKGIRGGTTRLSNHVLLFLHFGFIGLAQVIDVSTSSHVMAAMEEVFELDAAIVLVAYVAQQALVPRQRSQPVVP
jgi:hypothetical protein